MNGGYRGGGVVSIDNAVLRLLINEGGEWGVEDIEHRLDVPKSTISRSTDRLARKGLVTKRPDPVDKRRRIIRAATSTPPPTRDPRTAIAIVNALGCAS